MRIVLAGAKWVVLSSEVAFEQRPEGNEEDWGGAFPAGRTSGGKRLAAGRSSEEATEAVAQVESERWAGPGACRALLAAKRASNTG